MKTAYVPGIDSFAMKMSPGFFDNPKIGLPSTTGLMVVFSSRTGILQSLLSGQWLSDRCAHGSSRCRGRRAILRVRRCGACLHHRRRRAIEDAAESDDPCTRYQKRGDLGAGCGQGRSRGCQPARRSCRIDDAPSAQTLRVAVASADIVVTTTPCRGSRDPGRLAASRDSWLSPWARTRSTNASWSRPVWPRQTFMCQTASPNAPSRASCAVPSKAGLIAPEQGFSRTWQHHRRPGRRAPGRTAT